MHISTAMLNGAICPVTVLVGAVGIGLVVWRAFISKKKPQNVRLDNSKAIK